MPYFWTTLSMILALILLIAAIYGLVVWTRRRSYTRERFAFVALAAITSLTVSLFASIGSGRMPWHFAAALIHVASGKDMQLPQASWTDYGFLLLAYVLAIQGILQLHRNWDGLKSIEQHKHEQRAEPSGLISEGFYEIRRISKGEPPLQPYSAADSRQFLGQLEPVIDSLAWKDQARDLLKLSSSSYAFESESSWHDKEGCWVGRNVNSGDLVFLYPVQSLIVTSALNRFVQYAHRVTSEQGKQQPELIVALKDGLSPESVKQNGHSLRIETESSLLAHLVNFTDYRNEIFKRVEVNHLPDSNLTIKDVYVVSRYELSGSSEAKDNIEDFLLGWIAEPSQRQLALLGGYGQGKSTATLMLTYRLLRKGDQANGRVPLLIELRGTSPRNLTPLPLLGAWASQYNINPQALMRLHIAGRLILIFEGFDEMALVGDAEMRLKHFKTLWQFCYPNAKIMITGRPNFFLDEEEMKAALGISKPIGDRPYCQDVRLVPFDLDQIEKSLRAQKKEVREQICDLAKKNSRFRDLVARPSLLHIVSVLWERERLSEKVDQLNSAFIMDLFVRHSYTRQGLKEVGSPDFMALNTAEREYFMSGVAAYMAAKKLPNQITGAQLNEVIEDLIQAMPDSVSAELSAILGETTKPLRLRLQAMPELGVEHVKTDVRACGLLVDDPAAPGTFRFGHKSFMEYLFATVLSERIQKDGSEKTRAILRATQARIDDVLALPVAIEFLSELMAIRVKDEVPVDSPRRERSEAEIQRSIATRLLTTLLGPGAFRAMLGRFVLFDTVYVVSIRMRPPWLRFVGTLLRPAMSFTLAPMLLLMLWFTAKNSSVAGRSIAAPFMMATMMLMFATMAFSLVLVTGRHLSIGKAILWSSICKRLGISDSVLHRVAGTWILPWTKQQPFDLFFGNDSPGATSAANDPD